MMGRYQSGQLGLTVTQLTCVFVGSNPALPTLCGNSSVDRALAFQAGGRGFESRFPLSCVSSYKSDCLFLSSANTTNQSVGHETRTVPVTLAAGVQRMFLQFGCQIVTELVQYAENFY